jgi:hypothetical protein
VSKKVNIADFTNGSKDNKVVRFYCYQKTYFFSLPKLDENGKPVFNTDALGNNKTIQYQTFKFEYLPVIDKETHKPKMNDPRSFFDILPDDPNAERLIAYLTKALKDKHTKIVDEETYFKKDNPEAFRIAEAKKEVEDKFTSQIEDLKKQLSEAKKGK